VSVRPATPNLAAILTDLILRSKAYWGYDEVFMAASHHNLTLTAEYIAANLTYVAEEAGLLFGVYSLFEHTPQQVELDNLFVEPTAIGKGVGKLLFDHAVEQARQRGYREMRIVADPNAESFYLRQGATRVGAVASPAQAGRLLPLLCYNLV